MTDLLIYNGRLVTWNTPNEILDDSALLLRDRRIHDIGPSARLREKYPDAERLDARGQLVMPGNICAHTHFYGAFARGMGIPGPAPKDFPDILERLWWRLDRALLDVDVEYSTLVSLVDAIKHGTTTLIDHHASPNAIDSSLDQIADAVEMAGVRAALCYEVTDRNGAEGAQAGISENVRFLHAVKERDTDLLAATFGLHASLSLSDDTLEKCVAAAEGLDLQARTGNPTLGGIHAKIVLVTVGTETWSVVGSLNGGEVSHKLNRELLLLTDADPIHARLVQMFDHDWQLGEE